MIDVGSVTTEFSTRCSRRSPDRREGGSDRWNATLSAVAQALDGLGGKSSVESIVNGNQILAQLNYCRSSAMMFMLWTVSSQRCFAGICGPFCRTH